MMSEPPQVTTHAQDGVLQIVIDHPPLNASSKRVRQGLLDAIEQLRADPTLRAAVLIGAGRNFMAGADLREFDEPLSEPSLPAVIAAIEQCDKPVVAALCGAALGGGFELALGCDARIADPTTVVGLPEVTLGVIPGAGGTQRLPRLVGIAQAIDLVCRGTRIPAAQALEWGLIDAITPHDLWSAALERARSLIGTKRRLRDQQPPPCDAEAIEHATTQALRVGRGRPQFKAAIAAIKASATLDMDRALALERASFTDLRQAPDAAALRHLFFAERAAPKLVMAPGEPVPQPPGTVQTVAIVGTGTMGCAIALSVLDAGLNVLLLGRQATSTQQGADRIRRHDAARVQAGKLSAAAAAERSARLTACPDWSLLPTAQLVIETVVEDLAVKQTVFRELARLTTPGTLLASNTSYLDLDAIAAATPRPEDVLGLHFFTPANVTRVVEVVRGRATTTEAIMRGLRFAQQLGKLAVVVRNAFGFVGNRVFAAYRRQCEQMVEEGASPAQVDAALQAFGFAMGPFAVADLSGLDIAWRMRQARRAARKPTDPPVDLDLIADRLCEQGRLGRKVGAGYYRYHAAGGPPQPDPAVDALIAAWRAERGITPRPLTPDEIQHRALRVMAQEAQSLFAEGIVQRASDIDVVLVNGYGFPRWRGGAVHWAAQPHQGAALNVGF